jgi:NTE family protein
MERLRIAVLACALASLLVSCAQYPKAPRLAKLDDPKAPELAKLDDPNAYRLKNLELNAGNTNETFVFLALSGGGTRAAAFSYGVIQALSEAELANGKHVLMDEVDVISSVSGGSFASAYYGFHGRDKFLKKFPEDVLNRKIQRDLILRLLAPWNWWKLGSRWYGRSDLVAEYYGPIFGNETFGKLPIKRPLVLLNATDISMGARFGFTQDHFDPLCSDLNGVPLARGVTASSAFPVAFTPLSFRNLPSGSCGYETPDWVENALGDLEFNGAYFDRGRIAKSYEDPKRKVIHLSDGGLTDNIGLRGPLEGLLYPSAPLSITEWLSENPDPDDPKEREIDRVVFIAVNAKNREEPSIDKSSHPPGVFKVLTAASTNPMDSYSTDTVEMARLFAARWRQQQAGAPGVGPQVAFYVIQVRFELEQDEDKRKDLQAIKTKLQLPSKQVDLLVAKGGELLRQTVGYRCLMAKIGAAGSAEPVGPDDLELCPE